MISPSELVVNATKTPLPSGIPASEPGYCAMCGKSHEVGDLIQPFSSPTSFSDRPSLAILAFGWPDGVANDWSCLACVAVWTLDFTQRYSKSVVCAEGLFPAASNNDIAYWILNPPPPPFLFYLSDQKQQHLIWRAPVNLNQDIYFVRFGFKILTVRRLHVIAAMDASNILSTALSDARSAAKKKGAPVKSPFIGLARGNDTFKNGMLRTDIYKLAETMPSLQKHIDCLQSCTPGEIWALSAVLYAPNPQRPARSLPQNS